MNNNPRVWTKLRELDVKKNSIDPLLFQSLSKPGKIIDIEIEIWPKDET